VGKYIYICKTQYICSDVKGAKISSVNIRGASNYVHGPMVKSIKTSRQSPHPPKESDPVSESESESEFESESESSEVVVVWTNDKGWASREEMEEFKDLSYQFAVNTTSAVVLSLFQRRQQVANAQKSNFFRK
jgi:adenine deaminase